MRSRIGVELELIAPPGRSRFDLLEPLRRSLGKDAGRRGGDPPHAPPWSRGPNHVPITFGFKLLTLTVNEQGDWLGSCELTPAAWLGDELAVTDDFSIQTGLDDTAPPRDGAWRLVFDDARLARMAEHHLRSPRPSELLPQLLRLFAARPGQPDPETPKMIPIYDSSGLLLAIQAPYGEERQRVAEIVTRPLARKERADFLGAVLQAARSLGFERAPQGSVHVHFDGKPWQNSRALCSLITRWTQERDRLLPLLRPNPTTSWWRGPFPDSVVEVARRGVDLPFSSLSRELLRAGVSKRCDFNLLGVLRPHHPQCTLEARCFGGELEWTRLSESLGRMEEFLGDTQASSGLP